MADNNDQLMQTPKKSNKQKINKGKKGKKNKKGKKGKKAEQNEVSNELDKMKCEQLITELNRNLVRLRRNVSNFYYRKDDLALTITEVREDREMIAKRLILQINNQHKIINELNEKINEISELLVNDRSEISDLILELQEEYNETMKRLFFDLRFMSTNLVSFDAVRIEYDLLLNLMAQQHQAINEVSKTYQNEKFDAELQLLFENVSYQEERQKQIKEIVQNHIKTTKILKEVFVKKLVNRNFDLRKRLDKLAVNHMRILNAPSYIRVNSETTDLQYQIETTESVNQHLIHTLMKRQRIVNGIKVMFSDKRREYLQDLRYYQLYNETRESHIEMRINFENTKANLGKVQQQIKNTEKEINSIRLEHQKDKDIILHLRSTINSIKHKVIMTLMAMKQFNNLETKEEIKNAYPVIIDIRKNMLNVCFKVASDYYDSNLCKNKHSDDKSLIYEVGALGFKLRPTTKLNESLNFDEMTIERRKSRRIFQLMKGTNGSKKVKKVSQNIPRISDVSWSRRLSTIRSKPLIHKTDSRQDKPLAQKSRSSYVSFGSARNSRIHLKPQMLQNFVKKSENFFNSYETKPSGADKQWYEVIKKAHISMDTYGKTLEKTAQNIFKQL